MAEYRIVAIEPLPIRKLALAGKDAGDDIAFLANAEENASS
jgi:hypothetical protein